MKNAQHEVDKQCTVHTHIDSSRRCITSLVDCYVYPLEGFFLARHRGLVSERLFHIHFGECALFGSRRMGTLGNAHPCQYSRMCVFDTLTVFPNPNVLLVPFSLSGRSRPEKEPSPISPWSSGFSLDNVSFCKRVSRVRVCRNRSWLYRVECFAGGFTGGMHRQITADIRTAFLTQNGWPNLENLLNRIGASRRQ